MWSKVNLFLFILLFYFLYVNSLAEINNSVSNLPSENLSFFQKIHQYIRPIKNDVLIKSSNRNLNKDEINKLYEEFKKELKDDDFDLKYYLDEIINTKDKFKLNELKNNFLTRINKPNKITKKALQELVLCKINDFADEFKSLDKIIDNLEYGDIIEFKRLGYSHFSIYLGNHKLLQFETIYYNNITLKTILNDFPSITVINDIKETSKNDTVRVNNKIKLNLPVDIKEIESRVNIALNRNQTELYNIFFNNCEHFATYIRFGVSFSNQIDALFKIAKDISHPLFKLVFETLINH